MKLTKENIVESIINSKSLSSIVKSINKNKDFEIYIIEKTNFLIVANLKQRLYHIKNELISLQLCSFCSERELMWNNKYSKYKNTCKNKDCKKKYKLKNFDEEKEKERIIKIKRTKLERYGDENYNNIEKYKETCLEKYGVDHYTQTDEYKVKMTENYGYVSPFELEKTHDKSKKTLLERYGVDHNFKISGMSEKIQNTFLKKYGFTSPLKNEKIKEKLKKTNIEKYGYNCPLQNEIINQKSKNTLMYNFGVEYPLESEVITRKMLKTMLERYGVEYWIQIDENYEKLLKHTKSYKIYKMPNGEEVFIQGYEDVIISQLLEEYDENDIIIKNSEITKYTGQIYYELDGKKHKYYPDIYIRSINKIIEVKSEYTFSCDEERNLIKRKSCLDKNIEFEFIILTKKEYKKIKNKYGKIKD